MVRISMMKELIYFLVAKNSLSFKIMSALFKLILPMKKCKKEKLKEISMSKVISLKFKTYKKHGSLNSPFTKLKMPKKLQLFTLIKLNKFVFVPLITVSKMVQILVTIWFLDVLKEWVTILKYKLNSRR